MEQIKWVLYLILKNLQNGFMNTIWCSSKANVTLCVSEETLKTRKNSEKSGKKKKKKKKKPTIKKNKKKKKNF